MRTFLVSVPAALAARLRSARSIVLVSYDDPDAPAVADLVGIPLREGTQTLALDGRPVRLTVDLDVRALTVRISEEDDA